MDPLLRVLRRGADDMPGPEVTSQTYALGWALVRLLDTRYGRRLGEILRRQLIEKDTGLAVVRDLFPGEQFDRLEKELWAYVDEIGKAYREGRIYDGRIHESPR